MLSGCQLFFYFVTLTTFNACYIGGCFIAR